MNKVAAPCCGSCAHYSYDTLRERNCCHNKKEILFYGMSFPDRICAGNSYSPRNPILIIDFLMVKKLVESTWRAGFQEGRSSANDIIYQKPYEDNGVYEYMRTIWRPK